LTDPPAAPTGAAGLTWLRRGSVAALVLAMGLPLVLVDVFFVDWVNHLWLANYSAHMLASEGRLPSFVNTAGQIGNPFLAYYGSGVFGLAAPLVLVFGVHLGMRIAILVTILAPALAISGLVRRTTGSDAMAAGLTLILGGSVYQLTNLYSRSALTEFFAYQLLLFAAVITVDALTGPARQTTLKLALAMLLAALTVQGHPLTAYGAALFLAIPVLVLIGALRPAANGIRIRWAILLAVAFLCAVPLAGWLALILPSADGTRLAIQRLAYYPHSIDSLYSRLVPWSTDLRVDTYGVTNVSTPYLSAPLNLAAFAAAAILTAAVLSHRRRLWARWPWLAFAGLVAAAGLAALFLSLPYGKAVEPAPDTVPVFGFVLLTTDSPLHPVLRLLQFAYRLVNIVNLAAAIAAVGLLVALMRAGQSGIFRRRGWELLAVAGGALSLVLLFAKTAEVVHEYRDLPGSATAGRESWLLSLASREGRADALATAENLSRLPPRFYGAGLFVSATLFPEPDPGLPVTMVTMSPEGSALASAEAACTAPCAIGTDAFPSPLARATLDGRPVPPDRLRGSSGRLAVLVGESGRHRLDLRFGDWRTDLAGYGTTMLAALAWALGIGGILSAARERLRSTS